MNGIFGVFLATRSKMSRNRLWVLVVLPVRREKKKKNSMEYPWKETLQTDEHLPKKQTQKQWFAMDSTHCTFPPGSLYVTNHCKLTPWTLKPDGFLIKHRLPGAAWSQFLIWPRPRHQGYRPTHCRGAPQGGLLWQHELTSRRLASEWEKCSGLSHTSNNCFHFLVKMF